jgi:hypothetical protein
MKVFKIWGSDYYDQLKDKEFPLHVQKTVEDELNRVQDQVQEHLSKPKTDNKVVVSKIQDTFMSQEAVHAQANKLKADHYSSMQARKNGRV